MTLSRQHARETINIYIQAWQSQDADLIVTLFTEDAIYHERVLRAPIPDRAGIHHYWSTKVAQEQANIKCELLNLYVDGDTAIAEWEAEFDDVPEGTRKRMREIAIIVFRDDKICNLREVWASEII